MYVECVEEDSKKKRRERKVKTEENKEVGREK